MRTRLGTLARGALRAARWRRHRLEDAVVRRLHPLRYLFLELTRRCNLACAYCGSGCGPAAARPELATADWLRVIDEVAADFDPRAVTVALTGGEPLLHDGLDDLGRALTRHGFFWGLVSNGQLLTAARAARLVAAGVRSIALSLDGPPALNDRLRGRGVADGVAAALDHLRAAGFAGTLEIISTITAPAARELDAMRRHVAALRVARWRVSVVMPLGRARDRPELVPGPPELRQIFDFVRAARRDGQAPRPELCEEGYLGDAYEGEVRPYLSQCRAGITVAGILADGRIGACPELGDAFVQGDIARTRFRDVWDGRYQALRDRSWARRGPCAACAAFARCRGGSLHNYAAPGAEMARCFHRLLAETEPR